MKIIARAIGQEKENGMKKEVKLSPLQMAYFICIKPYRLYKKTVGINIQ